jgi:peptidylprolyl isomerase
MDKQNIPIIILIVLLILGIAFFVLNKNSLTENPDPEENTLTNIGDGSAVENSLNGLSGEDNTQNTQNSNNLQNSLQENKMQENYKQYSSQPQMTIDQNKSYTAVMKTNVGEIRLELDAKNTPITTNNFIFLAKDGFYNNTIFHRVIKDFMIQGGDPAGTGAGSPGYKFKDENIVGEYTRGTLAMANSGPDTNGSQFFIMHGDKPLPKAYVIFGRVTQGLDVVDKIASAEVTSSASGERSKPVSPAAILSIEIIEN